MGSPRCSKSKTAKNREAGLFFVDSLREGSQTSRMINHMLRDDSEVKSVKVTLADYPDTYIDMAPALELEMRPGTHYRALNVLLYALAAAVERASPIEEYWSVDVEWLSDEHGAVYLRLDDESPPTVARGMALLRAVAGEFQRGREPPRAHLPPGAMPQEWS